MTIPAWQLMSWKPVLTTLPEFRCALARMRPWVDTLGAAAEGAGAVDPAGGRRQGQALWASTHQGQPLGLAWDWAEVRKDVVALSDPMNVLSNVRLVDEAGAPLGAAEQVLHLNSAIHELEWQAHVMQRPARWMQPLAA